MAAESSVQEIPEDQAGVTGGASDDAMPGRSVARVIWQALSLRRIGAIYVWILAIIVFSILKPHVFPTTATVQGIASQYAVPGLAAVAIVCSLACGAFDVSIGANIGLTGMVFAVLHSEHPGMPIGVVVVLVMLVGLAIALANIVAVVVFEIDSFIGTLAMAAVLDAISTAISHGQFLSVSVHGAWSSVATGTLLGIQMPFWYLLIAVVVIAYLLERTKVGRYLYATGFDRETARLTGLPVARLRAAGYVMSGMLGAFTGMLYATLVASASPGDGDGFLIPAFSAAFLGATQVRPGRFNTWGTLIAVLLLGTGDYGITIAGGPAWATQLFEGLILLVAIALGKVGGRRLVTRRSLTGLRRSSVQVRRSLPKER